ncbi:hypothetical protein EsDP_00002676 [Epichloe bromicola]|uniref:Xylanolytic transcriptional activator regulatory domain-containing protein n=1 Tax=Epichloe bromicola TaxID=79588 RepID=A0ABQ0CLI7_9HYPO
MDGGSSSSHVVKQKPRSILPADMRSSDDDSADRINPINIPVRQRKLIKAALLGLAPANESELSAVESAPNAQHALKRKLNEMQDDQNTYTEIFEALRCRPEKEAMDILHRIRSGIDPRAILSRIKEGDLLLQVSLKAETRHRYVFPYSTEMPAYLRRSSTAYLRSLLYEWSMDDSAESLQAMANMSSEGHSPYTKPYHSAGVVDPLLGSAKPSEWTTVSADDAMMRKMLQVYFLNEYTWLNCFQKDYFLADMAAGRSRFCSALLVNALLASASMSYNGARSRHEYWSPNTLGYRFLTEAKRLWELEMEMERSRLTTVQAGVLLNIAHSMSGRDIIGWSYTVRAAEIAHTLGIFTSEKAVKSMTMRRARDFTAWAFFSYQILHAYVFQDTPELAHPPKAPLPDPSHDPAWFGEVWLRYPGDRMVYPTHFALQFKATVELRLIMHEICIQCFGDTMPSVVSQDKMSTIYAQLCDWYQKLPLPLQAENIALPSQIMLHMSYHSVLSGTFSAIQSPLLLVNAGESSTKEVVANADDSLELLIRLYYLRHGFEVGEKFLPSILSQLALRSLNALRKRESPSDVEAVKSTLVLAVKGLRDQGESFYLCQVLLRLLKSKMGSGELRLLSQEAELDDAADWQERQMKEVRGRWPPFIGVVDDPEAFRLSNLVKEYMDSHSDEESTYTSGSSP